MPNRPSAMSLPVSLLPDRVKMGVTPGLPFSIPFDPLAIPAFFWPARIERSGIKPWLKILVRFRPQVHASRLALTRIRDLRALFESQYFYRQDSRSCARRHQRRHHADQHRRNENPNRVERARVKGNVRNGIHLGI